MDSENDGVNSVDAPQFRDDAMQSLMESLLRAKEERRKALARLPIEEKIAIVVQLQKIAYEIGTAVGRSPSPAWRVPWEI